MSTVVRSVRALVRGTFSGFGYMKGARSFLLAFLLEVFTHRALEPIVAARTVLFHLDTNHRLFENTIRIHFGAHPLARTPLGYQITADTWRNWTPTGPLLPLLKTVIDAATDPRV